MGSYASIRAPFVTTHRCGLGTGLGRLILVLALQTINSVLAAWLTWKWRAAEISPLWLFPCGLIGTTLWVFAARSAERLTFLGIVWDVLIAGSYFLTFLALGESVTLLQALGAAMAIAGIVMMAC